MPHEKLHRHASELHHLDGHASSATSPGKVSLTQRMGRPLVLRVSDGAGAVSNGAGAAIDRAAASSGHALPEALRSRFESSLGADLSAVRLHTGADSADAAHAVGARAYAVGQDIHFSAGAYDPDSTAGVLLIAHEVAHTVQQAGSTPTRQHKLEVSTPGDGAEVEADRAAEAMVRGEAAPVLGGGGSMLARKEGEAKDEKKEEKKDDEKPWWEGFELTVQSPALTGFNEGPSLKIASTASGVTIAAEIAESAEKKWDNSWEIPFGPAGGAKVLGKVGVKLEAKGSISGAASFVTHDDDHDKDYAEVEVVVAGGLEVAGSGTVAAGPFVGVKDVANASVLVAGTLTAKGGMGIGGGGTVRVEKSGVSGAIKVPFDVGAGIDLTGSLKGIVEFIGEDVELFDLVWGKQPVADMSIKGTPTLSLPDGAVSGTPEVQPPQWKLLGEPTVTKAKKGLASRASDAARRARATVEAQEEQAREQAALGDGGMTGEDGTSEPGQEPNQCETPEQGSPPGKHHDEESQMCHE